MIHIGTEAFDNTVTLEHLLWNRMMSVGGGYTPEYDSARVVDGVRLMAVLQKQA